MLETTIEQLLLQYLAPYVDGISRDKLHLGVLSGTLELSGLTVKPEALSLLGYEGFRVKNSFIRLIRLRVPLRDWLKGKLHVIVDTLHVEVEQIMDSTESQSQEDMINEVREAKQKAIDLRMNQLRDLVGEQLDEQTGGKKQGLFVKILRKIISNIKIEISDVKFSVTSRRGLACGFEFPNLAVLSTDKTFREVGEKEEIVLEGKSMYKLLHLRDLGFRMSVVGDSCLDHAGYVISPISASLQFTHDLDNPIDQVMRVRLEVAHDHLATVNLFRSQVKHLRLLYSEYQERSVKLHDLMVPPEEEQSIFNDPELTKAEYVQLYERKLLQEWNLPGDRDEFTIADSKRMELIEAALSVRLLAKYRWKVRKRQEALNEEIARRHREESGRLEGERQGWFARARSRVFGSDVSESMVPDASSPEDTSQWISDEEREQLLKGIEEVDLVESVDVPQRSEFEFVIGHLALDLVDDRWDDEGTKQLLNLKLKEAGVCLGVQMAQDYRGQDTAAWQFVVKLKHFDAVHKQEAIFRFNADETMLSQEDDISKLGSRAEKYATEWHLENSLQNECNILKLHFDFQPLVVNLPAGALEQLLDFIRAPEVEQASASAPPKLARCVSMGQEHLAYEEYIDNAKRLLATHGAKANDIAAKVYERIPDKIELNLRISAPIVTVPVEGLGTARFSLGELRLQTTQPAELFSWDLALDLNHTSLRAESLRGERFDMIHPVPVHLKIDYRGADESHALNVEMDVETMKATLSPQALSILLATPGAVISIIYPNYGEATAVKLDEATATAIAASAPAGSASFVQRAGDFVRDVDAQDAMQVLEAATKKLAEMKRRTFRCNFRMQINTIALTLADSIMPVMRLQGCMVSPGMVLYFQNVPNMLSLDIHDGVLEWDVLNTRNGAWEPFGERFHLGVHLERKLEGHDGRKMEVVVIGKQRLLLNLTPMAIQRATWILPQFYRSLTFQPLLGQEIASASASGSGGAKYRVINLSDRSVELELLSSHETGLQLVLNGLDLQENRSVEASYLVVAPTGSSWKSLDSLVLPHFATAVIARMQNGSSTYSEQLSLEIAGAVGIPGSGLVAELMTPDPSHHLLLLATPLRVHNQTDLEVSIRFHNAADRGLLELDLPDTFVGDAALFGISAPDRIANPQNTQADLLKKREPHSITLAPNAICAVPEVALVRAGGSGVHNSRTWLSARPNNYDNTFCVPTEVGTGRNPSNMVCRASSAGETSGRVGQPNNPKDLHLVCESRWYDGFGNRSDFLEGEQAQLLPSFKITTACLQPTLSLLNALPIGRLQVAFAPMCGEELPPASKFLGVRVPCFKRYNLYCFPGILNQGVCVQVRIDDDAPWSNCIMVPRDAFKEADSTRWLQVRRHKDGAAAGVAVEPTTRYELRISCPYWFIDRSGMDSRMFRLDISRKEAQLPNSNGITLLPADCLEENCEVSLSIAKGSSWQRNSTVELRLPPSYCSLPLSTSIKPFVFCIQADDIAKSDALGASCQVMTLRPRVVLTNLADCAVEIESYEARDPCRPTVLQPEESLPWHWLVGHGEEDSPIDAIRFRPSRQSWSGKIMCGDSSAGANPISFPNGEVWSVDIAPVRGALAVSFRKGSEFVAHNKTREGVQMSIIPKGSNSPIVVPAGTEVQFGWPDPFNKKFGHGVDVMLNGQKVQIEDVRGKVKKNIGGGAYELTVAREATRTVLALEHSNASSDSSRLASGETCYQVELKLSHLGISLVEESPVPRELLFLHFDLLRMEWTRNHRGVQKLALAISEAQVNCQVEGRVDARTRDARRQEVLGLVKQERPVVMAANLGESDRAFFQLVLQRGATSCRDILLPHAEIALDALDWTIDDGWLDPLVAFVRQASASRSESGRAFSQIAQTAGTPITADYSPPPLPYVLQVDSFKISQVCLTMWCSLQLQSLTFLPKVWREAIKVLSFSDVLKLDGATLTLPERRLPPHRGSLADFVRGLGSEYFRNLLNHTASVLGKSSVLRVPRAPVKFLGTGAAYMSDSLGLMAGESAALLDTLTFDDEYVSRQRSIRQNKQINSFGDGMAEAGKSLAIGVEGMADIWTKSVEGAQTGGFGGFLSGLGKGAVGSFVKPFSAMGQAFQDVGVGVGTALSHDTQVMKRRRNRYRTRLPRLLFNDLGIIRPWSEMEARVQFELGSRVTRGVMEVIPLKKTVQCPVLLLFASKLVLADVKLEDTAQVGGSSSSSQPRQRNGSVASNQSIVSNSTQSTDVMDALDEGAFKILAQAMKPINTIVYGIQDIQGGSESPDEPDLSRKAWEFKLKHLKSARKDEKRARVLRIEDVQGQTYKIPLGQLSDTATEALVKGLTASLRDGCQRGIANWDELRQTLSKEEQQRAQSDREAIDNSLLSAGAGQRVLEVFEVERYKNIGNTWETPFHPYDFESCWRWVDASGNRHPHLQEGSRELLADSKRNRHPPCELDKMFKPMGPWEIQKNQSTDDQGWRYALAWNSSTWDSKPGLFDSCRKRKWTRVYT